MVHVVRHSDLGVEVEIPLAEWKKFIASDPDFIPAAVGDTDNGKNLFLLPTDSNDPSVSPWIAWADGRIHSKFCELAVLKKLGQMARRFGAVVMSDDGDIWTIDENGRITVEGSDTSMRTIILMPGWDAILFWRDADGAACIDEDTLPISIELKGRLDVYYKHFSELYHQDDWQPIPHLEKALLDDTGLEIWRQLRVELASVYRVLFWSDEFSEPFETPEDFVALRNFVHRVK